MIQDRSFNRDGSLFYPSASHGTHPVWVREFFGQFNCVNGKVAPYLDVEPRRYRFRVLNASNSRFYYLYLVSSDTQGRPLGDNARKPVFCQIGSDSGLMASPVRSNYLVLGPGERSDVVIDFSDWKGRNFSLVNSGPAPFLRGGEVVPYEVLLLKVVKLIKGQDKSTVPDRLATFNAPAPDEATRERLLALTEQQRASDQYPIIGLLDNKHWSDPVTETPCAGSTEIWAFANTTDDVHPIHMHLVRFQILDRQKFDSYIFLQRGELVYRGVKKPPEPDEKSAWKDTVKTYPGTITRVIAKFDLPRSTTLRPGSRFRYVWHCHMLEHEDNEMMRPFDVVV
jgi:spore coat protein A, manganese oxidase